MRLGFLYLSSTVSKASSGCIYVGLYYIGVSALLQLNAEAGHHKMLRQHSGKAFLSASAKTERWEAELNKLLD